jgi:outer membrane lipoprotein SlyB
MHQIFETPVLQKKFLSRVILFSFALCLAACATTGGPTPGEETIRTGVIEQITPALISTNHHQGVGAVVGGIAGLGLGSLIGGGSGRDVAMALGAIGGAVAGNAVQKKQDQPLPAQQIIVRTTSGVLVQITQPINTNFSLKAQQPVYIEGNGENARVVPR